MNLNANPNSFVRTRNFAGGAKYSKGGKSHLRDILVCADHVWRTLPNSSGSFKTPDAHNSALNDQYRDISEL